MAIIPSMDAIDNKPKGNAAVLTLIVNGEERQLALAADTRLLYVLRNDFRLNGPKYGCGLGACGACSVLIEGRAVRACTIPVSVVDGRAITTLEGLSVDGRPHPVQQAFVDKQAAQCGYCLNGMIIASVALLMDNPAPDEAQIRSALSRHLCRCGTHIEILAAVRHARDEMAARSIADETKA